MADTFNIVSRVKSVRTFKGIDNQGFESIVFILKNRPNFELKTSKIISRILDRPNEYRLFISLIDNDKVSSEIFDVLTEDLLSSVENTNNEQEVLEVLAIRFQYWSDLFKRKREQLDEKWIQGFIGELWFLDNRVIKEKGTDIAIRSWMGPEKANQDFITSDKIFEIKTCLQQANSIKISNDNQLSKDMYLVIIEVSKSSEITRKSVNLSSLIVSIKKKIDSPELYTVFNGKLLQLGLFPIEEAKLYDKFSYEIKTISYFEINSDFPFIDHSSIPEAVIKYAYFLQISGIKNFKKSEGEVWT